MTGTTKYMLKVIAPVVLLTLFLSFQMRPNSLTVLSFAVSYFLIYLVSANLYHRYWSHQQFELHPAFAKLTSFLGLFVMTGDPLSYAKTHRWHHAHVDTEKDYHSPIHGRFHSFIGWMFKKNSIPASIILDLTSPQNRYLSELAKNKVLIIWCGLIVVALLSKQILLGLLWAMCFSCFLELLTNTIAHSAEHRRPQNVKWLAWLTLSTYHSDHHLNSRAIPHNDPGAFLIRSLKFLKLVR